MKNSIKITSGRYRGQEILTPGSGTHPMGAREKLALFNMLAFNLPGAKVLDAFAGSGALGIEALSRGAESVTFIEKSSAAAQIIKKNLDKLNLNGQTEVIVGDAEKYFNNRCFDIILADPPYNNFDTAKVQHLVELLNNGGVLVLSHPGEAPTFDGVTLQKTNTYAGAKISIYYR
ncbi:16S rRNA (guanine(966)-N(2))-methyltransferase RsmD [Candidatus Saccharibacteria bacterium]|nr:16S rRNA (guanine(966)-N(2))-methyltransferase RsmD [Candidatus Saccharibacteria bacterium]